MVDVQGLRLSAVRKMEEAGCTCSFHDAENANDVIVRFPDGEVAYRRVPAMACPIDHLDDDVFPVSAQVAAADVVEFSDRWRESHVDAAHAMGCRCSYSLLDPQYTYPNGERAFMRDWPDGDCPVDHDDIAGHCPAASAATSPAAAPASPGVEALLAERAGTHGDFAEVARVAQAIKAHFRAGEDAGDFNPVLAEAFDLIATKMARICCGNPAEKDHWGDVAGYATLAVRGIEADEMEQDRHNAELRTLFEDAVASALDFPPFTQRDAGGAA